MFCRASRMIRKTEVSSSITSARRLAPASAIWEGCGKIADDSSFTCSSNRLSKSMTSPEANLAAALRERRAIIADENSRLQPEHHLKRLAAISEKISALERLLSRPVDPRLAHYLARCSYDKALEVLEAPRPSEENFA